MHRLFSYLLITLCTLTFSACSDSDDETGRYFDSGRGEVAYQGTWNIGGHSTEGSMKVSAMQFTFPDFPMQSVVQALFPDKEVEIQPGTYGMEFALSGSSDKAAYYAIRDNVWQAQLRINGEGKLLRLKFITLPAYAGVQSGNQATYSLLSDNFLITLRLTGYELLDQEGNEEENTVSNLTLTYTTKK